MLVNNNRVSLIGRVSMDMLALIYEHNLMQKRVILFYYGGKDLPVEEIARAAEMSPYQLLCGVRVRG